ncbi:hypothetical protein GYMLUDRAFT_236638 [Collybiopsis luxurians FD-317 M1]|nr:hypothetical protein GYMLUDRAFT_236638 [Collybiopsis luxurians FD-317 M1]
MGSLAPAGWSSIRPWIPPLSLSVREITSVSVTFVLSAATADPNADTDISLDVLGISTEDLHEDEDEPYDEDTSASESEAKKTMSVVSSALAGGLSVEVDRSSWRRVFIRIDDKADEAVIIVYGLMPGRQYEIVLELVQGGQTNSIRQQVTTEETETRDASHPSDIDSANKTAASSSSNSETNGTVTSTRPTTPDNSGNIPQSTSSPGYGFAPLTLEDRITQLQHTLSVLNSEQTSLNATIKTSRRDAQKADANLRSEIDGLKRASERYLSSEQRSKQKVLALQEAVKRSQAMTKEMEDSLEEANNELPGLSERKKGKEAEYEKVKDEATKVRQEKDEEEDQERKRVETMKSEMNSLVKQLEKLETKKEKLESVVIKELEEQLESIEQEMETLEKGEEALSNGSNGAYAQPPTSPSIGPTWTPPSRISEDELAKSLTQGTMGRPLPTSVSPPSVQRPRGPIHPNSTPLSNNPQWTPITSPRQSQQNQQNGSHMNQRSSSLPQPNQHGNHPHYPQHHHHFSHPHPHLTNRSHQPSPTTILTNPNRQILRNTPGGSGTLPLSGHVPDSSDSSSSPSPGMVFTPSGMSGSNSSNAPLLSGRAPPFEPIRGMFRRSSSRSGTGVGV